MQQTKAAPFAVCDCLTPLDDLLHGKMCFYILRKISGRPLGKAKDINNINKKPFKKTRIKKKLCQITSKALKNKICFCLNQPTTWISSKIPSNAGTSRPLAPRKASSRPLSCSVSESIPKAFLTHLVRPQVV